MKRFVFSTVYSVVLSLLLIFSASVQADVKIIVDFEEFGDSIGSNSSWNYLSDFPAGFGAEKQVESGYGGYTTELAYQSKGVTFYNQNYLGTRLSTVTDTAFRSYENDMASVTGSGNNGSKTYGVVFGDSEVGVGYDSPTLPRISLPTGALLDSMAICNTVYLDYLLHGEEDPYGFSRPMNQEGDFMNLIIYGIDPDGLLLNSLTVSLGNFTDGILTTLNDWATFDLSSLAGAEELRFAFDGNDIGYGLWLNLPVYFAFDDLTYHFAEDASTPEPAAMLIFGLGLAGLVLARRRK
ncbi:MAG: DUF4465 domain-containing protein [Planctomycetaceae bacterium]|nr:DUF4465 domain-containing protein [Planctomycetaceae bacterium]